MFCISFSPGSTSHRLLHHCHHDLQARGGGGGGGEGGKEGGGEGGGREGGREFLLLLP